MDSKSSTRSVENFVEIASQVATTFCRCNTSSRLHSSAALRDSLFDQTLAWMKQRLERSPEFLSITRGQLFGSLLALFSLVLSSGGCVKRSRDTSRSIKLSTQPAASPQAIGPEANDRQSGNTPRVIAFSNQTNARRININTAPIGELEQLPGIGKGLAERIVDHRERFGPFRRTEHLIIVRGISDRRFRALRDLITVE